MPVRRCAQAGVLVPLARRTVLLARPPKHLQLALCSGCGTRVLIPRAWRLALFAQPSQHSDVPIGSSVDAHVFVPGTRRRMLFAQPLENLELTICRCRGASGCIPRVGDCTANGQCNALAQPLEHADAPPRSSFVAPLSRRCQAEMSYGPIGAGNGACRRRCPGAAVPIASLTDRACVVEAGVAQTSMCERQRKLVVGGYASHNERQCIGIHGQDRWRHRSRWQWLGSALAVCLVPHSRCAWSRTRGVLGPTLAVRLVPHSRWVTNRFGGGRRCALCALWWERRAIAWARAWSRWGRAARDWPHVVLPASCARSARGARWPRRRPRRARRSRLQKVVRRGTVRHPSDITGRALGGVS